MAVWYNIKISLMYFSIKPFSDLLTKVCSLSYRKSAYVRSGFAIRRFIWFPERLVCARPNRLVVRMGFASFFVYPIQCASQRPNINPIERFVWAFVMSRKEWARISVFRWTKLVEIYPKRLAVLFAAKIGTTKYKLCLSEYKCSLQVSVKKENLVCFHFRIEQ